MQNKANFQKSQMNVRPLVIMNYERKSDWTLGENKPNSKPNKANLKRAKMDVNSLITKDYRKKDDFAVQKNKAKTNPISEKPKMNISLVKTRNYNNEQPTTNVIQNKANSKPMSKTDDRRQKTEGGEYAF